MGAMILAGAVAAVAPFFLEEQARPLANDLLVELPARPFSFAKSNQETKADQDPVLAESSNDKISVASAPAEGSKNGAAGESNTAPVKASTAPAAPTTPTTPVKAQTTPPSSATSKALTPAPAPAATPPAATPPAATPVAAPTTPATRQLMVQVGAYATAEAANRVKLRLQAGGNRVVVETTTNAEGVRRYRVRIGPFDTREAAIEVRDRAKAQGYDAALVRS